MTVAVCNVTVSQCISWNARIKHFLSAQKVIPIINMLLCYSQARDLSLTYGAGKCKATFSGNTNGKQIVG
jgi:hypothetical protein